MIHIRCLIPTYGIFHVLHFTSICAFGSIQHWADKNSGFLICFPDYNRTQLCDRKTKGGREVGKEGDKKGKAESRVGVGEMKDTEDEKLLEEKNGSS